MLNIHSSLVVYLPVIPLVFWRRVAGVEFGFATQSIFPCFFGLMRPQAGFPSDLLIWCLRPPTPKQDQMLCNIEPRPLWGRKKGRGEARQLSTANSLCGIGESQLMCCSTRWCLIRCTAILFKVPLYDKNLPAGSKDSLVLWPVDELPRWGKFIPLAPPVRGCAEVCSSVLFVMP